MQHLQKTGGGSVMVSQTPDEGCLSRANIGIRGIPLHAQKDSRLPSPSFRGAPSESCRKGSLTSQEFPPRPHICRRRRSKRASDCLVAPFPQQIQRSAL